MKNTELKGMIKRLLMLGLLFVVAAIIITAVQKKQSTTIREVVFEIEKLSNSRNLINPDDIRMSIERSFGHNLEGTPIGELNVERVERVLEDDPFILNADVYLDAKNKVHIGVQQRRPVLRVIDKNGLSFYLDEMGAEMPMSAHFTACLLVANGNIPPHAADYIEKKNMLHQVFDLSKYIMADEFLSIMIDHIHVNANNEITLIPKIGDHKIHFGKYEFVEDKFDRLKLFYKEGLPYEGWQKYKTINLKYRGQVVCKKRRP